MDELATSDEGESPQKDDLAQRLDGLSEPETRAALLLERATGGCASAFDIGGRQGAHDFNLVYADGRTAAVEVTSHSLPGHREVESRLANTAFSWPNPGRWDWTITVDVSSHLRKLRDAYARVILLCEEHGVSTPDLLPHDARESTRDVQWLASTSIKLTGRPVPEKAESPGPVRLFLPAFAAFPDENLSGLDGAVANLFAERSIARRVEKVSAVRADEHHLFIALDYNSLPSPISVQLFGSVEHLPPTSSLVLPGQLTHLWLAPRFLHQLLGWTPATGWRVFDVFDSDC